MKTPKMPNPPASTPAQAAATPYTSSATSLFGAPSAVGSAQANLAQTKRRALIGGAA